MLPTGIRRSKATNRTRKERLMFDSFPLDDTGCDFLFAGGRKATLQKQGLLTELPTGIGNHISSSSVDEELIDNTSFLFNEEDDNTNIIQPSKYWNDEPAKEIYTFNNSNETTYSNLPPNPFVQKEKIILSKQWDEKPFSQVLLFGDNNQMVWYPVRAIIIKSITECSNGYLIESTEKKSKQSNHFCRYVLREDLFNHFKHQIKIKNQIIFSYVEKEILKQDLKIRFEPRFGKKVCGVIINQHLNRKAFYREVKNIFTATHFCGLHFDL